MKSRKYASYSAMIISILSVITVVFLSGCTKGGENTPTPTTTTEQTSALSVTHKIENLGKMPLHVTIQAMTNAPDIREIAIVLDDGITKQSISCVGSSCEVKKTYNTTGVVKYYAFAKTISGETVADPENAPSGYKSFKIG